MALTEYVGSVVLEVDGQEVEVVSFSPKEVTGKKPVKTMNRKRRIAGYCDGIATYEITCTVAIPVNGNEPDWANMVDAKMVVYPVSGNGTRTAYTGCCTQDIGEQYEAENEARRDLTIFAQDKKEE